jgi:hypothetical protein
MSTQLNLGASYIVNDFYHRFINLKASEKQLVKVGRLFTIISVILGASLGLVLKSAGQAFTLLLMIGSGTGLIYILRWFWWRINAYTEIIAMISSLIIACIFNFSELGIDNWQKIVLGSLLTSLIWILATFLTPPDDDQTLKNFVNKINPGGPGWKKYSTLKSETSSSISRGVLSMFLGCIVVYGALIGTGQLLYGYVFLGSTIYLAIVFISILLFKIWQ